MSINNRIGTCIVLLLGAYGLISTVAWVIFNVEFWVAVESGSGRDEALLFLHLGCLFISTFVVYALVTDKD